VPNDARQRLLDLLKTHAFARRRVILASGKESDFFIDCKDVVLSAEGHALVGSVLFDEMARFRPFAAVAGVELGGCPLASAVALTSYHRLSPIDAIYVRKDAKDHGSARLLEGSARLPPLSRVVLVEDVVTTGGSTLKAATKLQDAGHVVAGVLALVDRLEGGRQAIEAAGRPFAALYTRDDFIPPG
jgi:orotate phosphoribosyltransferase